MVNISNAFRYKNYPTYIHYRLFNKVIYTTNESSHSKYATTGLTLENTPTHQKQKKTTRTRRPTRTH